MKSDKFSEGLKIGHLHLLYIKTSIVDINVQILKKTSKYKKQIYLLCSKAEQKMLFPNGKSIWTGGNELYEQKLQIKNGTIIERT